MRKEKEFEDFLSSEKTINSDKAVRSRMIKARKAESLLSQELDDIVGDDGRMYEALLSLREQEDPAHSPMQNALRKYYKFIHGREFPQLRNYKK